MMKRLLFFLVVTFVFGSDGWYRAFLTSHEFRVEGILYGYDFNKDGKIEDDEYLYLSGERLYHTDLAKGYPLFLQPIEFDIKRAQFFGYVARYKEERLFLGEDGKVYRFLRGEKIFDPLDEDLTYEIDNGMADVVYKKLSGFEKIVAHYDTPGFAWSLIVDGERVIVADGKEGVLALDLINGVLQPAWSYKSEGEVLSVAKIGEELYALGTDRGLEIYDAKAKVLKKRLLEGAVVSKVEEKGGKLYLLVEKSGVYVMGNDMKPLRIDASVKEPQDFCVTPDALYIADGQKGVVEIGQMKRLISKRDDIKALAFYKNRFLLMLPWKGSEIVIYDLKKGSFGKLLSKERIASIKATDDALYLLYEHAAVSRWKDVEKSGKRSVETAFLPYPSLDIAPVDMKQVYITDGGFGVLLFTN